MNRHLKLLSLANKAKRKDLSKKYVEAFVLYMQALDYFADAAKHVPGGILVSLNRTMKAYVERAEKIKKTLEKYNKVPKFNKPVFKIEDVTEYHLKQVHEKGIDGRVGTVEKKIMTNFWNDGRPFIFQVQIDKNVVDVGDTIEISILLDNKTSVEVDSIRVHLNEYITNTTILLNGRKQTNCIVNRIGRLHFKEDSKFPMSMSKFKGKLKYELATTLDGTEADTSACFAREHELSVQCIIPYHQNVVVNFPIRIHK